MRFSQILAKFAVSLFTREWIEIRNHDGIVTGGERSPSLRGSGLKMGQRTAEEKQQAASPSHKIASVSNSKPLIFQKQK